MQPDPLGKIEEMMISSDTINEYKSEWKAFHQWCNNNICDPYEASSANLFLTSLKTVYKVSTIKKKRTRLQSILQFLNDKPIFLRRIGMRSSISRKYPLSETELKDYLEEQEKIDEEDHLIQLMLVAFGCRIHSIACLKIKHLEFLNGGSTMFLPDTKTGTREVEVDSNLKKRIENFLKSKELSGPECYVFSVNTLVPRRRAVLICMRINKRIKDSTVLKKSDNYVYSSHMFRKTKAYTLYRKLMEQAKQTVRNSIGHAESSSAINYYTLNKLTLVLIKLNKFFLI
jgi:integrase